jgi:hypothetical protein
MGLVLYALKAIGASVWAMAREDALRPLIFLTTDFLSRFHVERRSWLPVLSTTAHGASRSKKLDSTL